MLDTERLLLRQWRYEDFPVYAQLNADPTVMRYFPACLSRQQSDEQAHRHQQGIAEKGWGFWAVELKSTGEFIGITGLHAVSAESGIPHAPLLEIGWRLCAGHWGKGYATEAAKRSLRFAFEQLGVSNVYAFTARVNQPSQRVMIKAGMENTGEVFDNPKLAPGHELERHCLYRITKGRYQSVMFRQLTKLAVR